MAAGPIHIKRIYDLPSADDGQRVLIDRVWPRGVKRGDAHLTQWLKDLAPSAGLRKWFGHDPARFAGFKARYREELDDNADGVAALRALVGRGKVTLLYGARDEAHNNAVVLADYLKKR